MSSKIKFFMVATLALAFGIFVGTAAAQDTTTTQKQDQDNVQKSGKFERRGGFGRHDGAGPGFRGGPEGMLREFRDLNLTDAQKQQIHSILESNKPDQASMDQMRTLGEARRNGTLTDDQKQQLKTLRQQQGEKMKSVHEQVMNVLTPEQKQQLEQKRQEMRQKWQQRQQQPDAPKTDKSSEKPTN
jgi:Spy/CpxP family protein refolding chaperone